MTQDTPRSIRLFEGLSLASLLLGLVNVALAPNISWIFAILVDGVIIALILLVSRGGKNWARWVLAVLFGLGLIFMIWDVRAVMAEANALITLGVSLLQAIGLIMLFTPQSSAWFRKKESLAETFS